MIVAVTGISFFAFSTEEPVRYTVFPALIWAAFRFGPRPRRCPSRSPRRVAIGETANDVGPFAEQPIDHQTLSTQLYICGSADDAVRERRGERAGAILEELAAKPAEPRASGRWRNGAG